MAQLLSREEKLKQKRALKIKKSLDKEIDDHNLRDVSSSETEEVDFSKVIRPIGYYIDEREQMIEEMFSIMKGEQLRKMLPPILKNCTLEELKADCLVHLLGMSRKRIFAILEGHELSSSSDSEADLEDSMKELNKTEDAKDTNSGNHSSNSDDDALSILVSKKEMEFLTKDEVQKQTSRKKKSRMKMDILKQEPTCSIVILDSESDQENKSKLRKKLKERQQHKKQKKSSNIHITVSDLSDVSEIDESNKKQNKECEEMIDKGKSLLEILELEMRARAIRALLKSTPNLEESTTVSKQNVKPEISGTPAGAQIGKTIDEAIESTLQEKSHESELTDVELIDDCDVDLCITIDDDDDIFIKKSPTPVIDITSPDKNSDLKNMSEDERSGKNPEPIKVSEVESTTCKNHKPSSEGGFENLVKDTVHLIDNNKDENSIKDTVHLVDNNKEDISWSEHWAESKNVKEIMKNSKICANLRKRMRFARMLKQKQMLENKSKNNVVVDFSNVEESSVAQYNLIKSLDKVNNDKEAKDKSTNGGDKCEEANTGVQNEELRNKDHGTLNEEVTNNKCVS